MIIGQYCPVRNGMWLITKLINLVDIWPLRDPTEIFWSLFHSGSCPVYGCVVELGGMG